MVALSKLADKKDIYLKSGENGLDKYSPKMKAILKNMEKTNGLVFIYSNFRTMEGVGIFSIVLEANGYSSFGTDNNLPKYAIYSGTENEETRSKILDVFTHPSNKHGERIKVIMATSAGAEGLDLKNIRQVHIMDPYWYESRNKQVIGRAVRRASHKELPKEEQNVEIYRYLSIFHGAKKNNKKRTKSTDEYIYEKSMKNQTIIEELLDLMKSTSVDCLLNKPEIKGDYKCLDFGKNVSDDQLAYSFKYAKDISIETRTKKIKYSPGYVHKKSKKIYIVDVAKKSVHEINTKSKKKFQKMKPDKTTYIKKMRKEKMVAKIMINLDNGDIFAPNNIKTNPKKIGRINDKSIFVKL